MALDDLRRTLRNLEPVDVDIEELEVIEEEMGLPSPSEAEKRQLQFWQRLSMITRVGLAELPVLRSSID